MVPNPIMWSNLADMVFMAQRFKVRCAKNHNRAKRLFECFRNALPKKVCGTLPGELLSSLLPFLNQLLAK